MFNYLSILVHIIFLMSFNINNVAASTCENKILEVKTTSIPDEFQASVILNSFLKDYIIEDMTSWFVDSHFPYGNSAAWHKINLQTSTVKLYDHGIHEELVLVYYQSQNYCGIGGQCSTFLLRKINDEWQKIEQWHDVKWNQIYINNCEKNIVNILLDEVDDFVAAGPNSGRLIKINFN